MIDSGVVGRVGIQPYADCDHLARPSIRGAGPVATHEPAHDIRVIFLDIVDGIIYVVEAEVEIGIFQVSHNFLVA